MNIEDKIRLVESTIINKNMDTRSLDKLYVKAFELSKNGSNKKLIENTIYKNLKKNYGQDLKENLINWMVDKMEVHGQTEHKLKNGLSEQKISTLVGSFNSWYGLEMMNQIIENILQKPSNHLYESYLGDISKNVFESFKSRLATLREDITPGPAGGEEPAGAERFKKKRHYLFDWDDNILMMPTMINMEKKEGDQWVPVKVSTEEFREVRNDKNYRITDYTKAFEDFRNDEAFLRDSRKAMYEGNLGPSFEKFKETLIHGNNFAIITARGHSPKAIRKGVENFIYWMLDFDTEFKQMSRNIKDQGYKNVGQYLNQQEYHPVSSDEFAERFGLDIGANNPEEGKKIAITDYVKNVMVNIQQMLDQGYHGISVGFSDDDIGNVEQAEELIRQELLHKFPHITFVVYDTGDPKDIKKKKIVIEKKD